MLSDFYIKDFYYNSVNMLDELKAESMENSFLLDLYAQGIDGSSAERLAKIMTLINDIVHRHPFTRERWVEVALLLTNRNTQELEMEDYVVIRHNVRILMEYFVNEKLSINFDDELKGMEVYLECWISYFDAWEKLESLTGWWCRRIEREERNKSCTPIGLIDEYTPFESTSTIMMTIWAEKINNLKKTMIGSVFRNLRNKDADMTRAATLIKLLLDSITDLELVLGYYDREIYKDVVESSYACLLRDQYQEESRFALSMFSRREYIQKCIVILDFEVKIVSQFLPESVEAVLDALGNTLIIDHFNVLLPEFKSLEEFLGPEDLKKIYRLIEHSPEAMTCLKKELHEEAILCKLQNIQLL